jgi:hypothetical protein
MPTIKFSDKELENLRLTYMAELQGAIDYVDKIRRIIVKLGGSAIEKQQKDLPVQKEPKKGRKRGRPAKKKPAPYNGEELTTLTEKKKPGRPKKQNAKKVKKQTKTAPSLKSEEPKISEAKKKVVKKKRSRKNSSRWGGVRLAPMGKPLKKATPVETTQPVVEPQLPTPEPPQENQ